MIGLDVSITMCLCPDTCLHLFEVSSSSACERSFGIASVNLDARLHVHFALPQLHHRGGSNANVSSFQS